MLETLLDMVQELGASKVSSSSTFSLPEGITLPLQSLEDVEGLEKELRQQTVLNNMVRKPVSTSVFFVYQYIYMYCLNAL
jgi:hypothetical protein